MLDCAVIKSNTVTPFNTRHVTKVHRYSRPMAFAHMAVSFGPTPPQSPTPSMVQFPNPGLCINYFICNNFLGQVMVPDFDSIPIKHVFNMTCYTF